MITALAGLFAVLSASDPHFSNSSFPNFVPMKTAALLTGLRSFLFNF